MPTHVNKRVEIITGWNCKEERKVKIVFHQLFFYGTQFSLVSPDEKYASCTKNEIKTSNFEVPMLFVTKTYLNALSAFSDFYLIRVVDVRRKKNERTTS